MPDTNVELFAEVKRLERLLALVAIKDLDEGRAVLALSRAGLTNPESARLLGITSNAVKLRLRRMRRPALKKKDAGRRRKKS